MHNITLYLLIVLFVPFVLCQSEGDLRIDSISVPNEDKIGEIQAREACAGNGNMRCLSSTQFQTCSNGQWSVPQNCQSSLYCNPNGNFIYCGYTNPDLTTQSLTTQPMTSKAMTTQPLTTQPLTTKPLTTQALSTQPMTTMPMTSKPLTTQPLTTQPLTTQPLSTQAVTSKAVTSSALTTKDVTTQVLTTQPLTTHAITTQPLTSKALSTAVQSITSLRMTTQQVSTTKAVTSAPLTTKGLSTQALTTKPVTSQAVTSGRMTTSTQTSGSCGDGVCGTGESCGTCARDCGLCSTYTCSPTYCQLPNCKCADRGIPGGLQREVTPQFVMLTWDDSINAYMMPNYRDLIYGNPAVDSMGCRIRQSFYVLTDQTEWNYVQELRAVGSELISHTLSHSNSLRDFNATMWYAEVVYAREYIAQLTQTPLEKVVGFRAPYLRFQDLTFQAIEDGGMLYDASIADSASFPGTNGQDGKLLWPYTFDQGTIADCGQTQGLCPTKSHPGIWEVSMNSLHHLDGTYDLMDPQGSASFLLSEFKRNFLLHYNGNRSPFGIYLHYTWFSSSDRLQILKDFYAWVATYQNVFFATPSQIIAWTKNPRPASQVSSMPEFTCPVLTNYNGVPTTEVCDGIDNDLDGQIDEGVLNTCSYLQATFKTCAKCPRVYPGYAGPEEDVPDWTGIVTFTGDSTCTTMNIKNTNTLSSQKWIVEFDVPNGVVIQSVWSADMVRTGQHYKLTNLGWNNIVAGGTTYSGVGWCGGGTIYNNAKVTFG